MAAGSRLNISMRRLPKKKFRGQRKYYRKLKELSNYDWLDLTGGVNSWFDLWHDHMDWKGWGNINWKHRKPHLDALVSSFELLKMKLVNYTKDFQLFMYIEVNDSSSDAVYINTENPNGHRSFPMKLKFVTNKRIPDGNLRNFIDELPYVKITSYYEEDGFSIHLYDKKFGLPIEVSE